ncbi:hypothetical protein AUR04nite_01110 [Glutamicibacter uratoxydans]|uniref:Uncharacterized protein n=1 Tax=Glutamicibacter uratoxydans TaxID=43667 RepID=A0A4Y4DH82_GLUUR|nr:DUF6578 domain-containing protein [Glutamicibacter uratoxydans]GED04579.1 hypothetical protein AUR04nite_01110 [Glutamicibacter uratoxydans]
MKINVHIAAWEYGCCGEDLWLGKRVSWPIALVREDESQILIQDNHDQCSEHGADVVAMTGTVEKIRVLHKQHGAEVWTELDQLKQSMDFDGDELDVELQVPDGQRIPASFSWSEVDYEARAQESQRIDDAYRKAEEAFIGTELHGRLMALGRDASDLLGPQMQARADHLGGLSISGPGSNGTCWRIGVAGGIDQDVEDIVLLEVGSQEWELKLSGAAVDQLAGVVDALAAQRTRRRTQDTPPDQILDDDGVLWV